MSNKKNVLVIGGGIAGLSAALELACLDIGVELVEKSEIVSQFASKKVTNILPLRPQPAKQPQITTAKVPWTVPEPQNRHNSGNTNH